MTKKTLLATWQRTKALF